MFSKKQLAKLLHTELFQSISNIIPTPLIVIENNKIINSNKIFLDFLSFSKIEEFEKYNEDICDNFFIKNDGYFSPKIIDSDVLWIDYIYNIAMKSSDRINVSISDSNGKFYILEVLINRLNREEGSHLYVVIFVDITAFENKNVLLRKMAYSDPLTGIYNRNKLNDELLILRNNTSRYGDNLSMILIDIDYFKKINDNYGHNIGDMVLVLLTKIIKANIRLGDVFARWGGEEFLILLPRTDCDVACQKAKKLQRAINNYTDDSLPKFTSSFGVTNVVDSDEEGSCFARVDKALYEAKIKRNDVVCILAD